MTSMENPSGMTNLAPQQSGDVAFTSNRDKSENPTGEPALNDGARDANAVSPSAANAPTQYVEGQPNPTPVSGNEMRSATLSKAAPSATKRDASEVSPSEAEPEDEIDRMVREGMYGEAYWKYLPSNSKPSAEALAVRARRGATKPRTDVIDLHQESLKAWAAAEPRSEAAVILRAQEEEAKKKAEETARYNETMKTAVADMDERMRKGARERREDPASVYEDTLAKKNLETLGFFKDPNADPVPYGPAKPEGWQGGHPETPGKGTPSGATGARSSKPLPKRRTPEERRQRRRDTALIAYDSGMAFRPNKENRRKLRQRNAIPESKRDVTPAPAPRNLLNEPISPWMQDPGAALLDKYPMFGLQQPIGPQNRESAPKVEEKAAESKRDAMPEQITYRSRRQAFGEGTVNLRVTNAADGGLEATQNYLQHGTAPGTTRLATNPMSPSANKTASADVASSGAAYVKAPSAAQLSGGPGSAGHASGAGSSGGDEHLGNIAGKRMQLKGVANLNINGIPSGELQLNLEGSGGGM